MRSETTGSTDTTDQKESRDYSFFLEFLLRMVMTTGMIISVVLFALSQGQIYLLASVLFLFLIAKMD